MNCKLESGQFNCVTLWANKSQTKQICTVAIFSPIKFIDLNGIIYKTKSKKIPGGTLARQIYNNNESLPFSACIISVLKCKLLY